MRPLVSREQASIQLLLIHRDTWIRSLSSYGYSRPTSPGRALAPRGVLRNALHMSYTLLRCIDADVQYPRVLGSMGHLSQPPPHVGPELPQCCFAGISHRRISANTFYFSRETASAGFPALRGLFHSLADMAWRTPTAPLPNDSRPRLGFKIWPGAASADVSAATALDSPGFKRPFLRDAHYMEGTTSSPQPSNQVFANPGPRLANRMAQLKPFHLEQLQLDRRYEGSVRTWTHEVSRLLPRFSYGARHPAAGHCHFGSRRDR